MEVLRACNGSPWSGPEVLDSGRFAKAAESVAGFILRHVFRARDNTICWRHPVEPIEPFHPTPLGPHLYSGTLGIACFLAAAVRVLPEREDLRSLLVQALVPLRLEIRSVVNDTARSRALRQPIGGLSGLGSIVYGLMVVGDLLGDFSFVDDAYAVSALITPERISSDESFEVMVGSAGALLALVALHERHPGRNLNGRTPLEVAGDCAEHLLKRAGRPAVRGFCHGMTGISTALLRLYRKTGRQELWDAAWEGFTHERGLPATGTNSWCKGAPGIALGHVERLGISGDPIARDETVAALEVAGWAPLSDTDDLCCGNAGRIDVLLHAWRNLGDSSWLAAARDLADRVLDRAIRNQQYALKLHGPGVLDLRLFNGLAGVGYVMARLLATDHVPCIVAME